MGKPTNIDLGIHTDGVWWVASPTCAATSKLKSLGGCLSHHLQGAGAYCGSHTTGRTVCWNIVLKISYSFTCWRIDVLNMSSFVLLRNLVLRNLYHFLSAEDGLVCLSQYSGEFFSPCLEKSIFIGSFKYWFRAEATYSSFSVFIKICLYLDGRQYKYWYVRQTAVCCFIC